MNDIMNIPSFSRIFFSRILVFNCIDKMCQIQNTNVGLIKLYSVIL